MLPNLLHGNDGLVFTCRSTPYTPGTDEHVLKWKPPSENTIDFRLQLGDFPMTELDGETLQDFDACSVLNLLVYHGTGRHEHFGELYVTEFERESLKSMNRMLDGSTIECHRDEQGR